MTPFEDARVQQCQAAEPVRATARARSERVDRISQASTTSASAQR
ncbi:hypothetical protein [Streptomyces litmocidini]